MTIDHWAEIKGAARAHTLAQIDDVERTLHYPNRTDLLRSLYDRLEIIDAWEPNPAWKPPRRRGWVGVDLDRTLAYYERWEGVERVGAPIAAMAERVQQVLRAGAYDVRIFTARCSPTSHPPDSVRDAVRHIKEWCRLHLGTELEVTCEKDKDMVELWDDLAVGVEENTGVLMSPSRVLGLAPPLELVAPAGMQLKLPGTEPARPPRKRAAPSTRKRTAGRK